MSDHFENNKRTLCERVSFPPLVMQWLAQSQRDSDDDDDLGEVVENDLVSPQSPPRPRRTPEEMREKGKAVLATAGARERDALAGGILLV